MPRRSRPPRRRRQQQRPAETHPVAVQAKSKELRDTLDNKSASADDIKAKLTALREARTQAKADLTKAEDDLREPADRPAGSGPRHLRHARAAARRFRRRARYAPT